MHGLAPAARFQDLLGLAATTSLGRKATRQDPY